MEFSEHGCLTVVVVVFLTHCYVMSRYVMFTLRCVMNRFILSHLKTGVLLPSPSLKRLRANTQIDNKTITKHFSAAVLFVLFSSERTGKHCVITFVFVDPN